MRRRRGLSDEEARLWAGVARQARPLPGKRLPVLPEGPEAGTTKGPPPAATVAARPPSHTTALAVRSSPAKSLPTTPVKPSLMPSYQAPAQPKAAMRIALAAVPRSTTHPVLHPIEKPVKRKLGAGRVAIEDRIDLHDRTQIVAHYALLGFLRQAQANGLRHVLVITGRGASSGSPSYPTRGVIKRSLPHWFGTPEFRALVAGYEPAERHHGGEGAFYVRVRRR